MVRAMSAAMAAEIAKPNPRPFLLADLDFPSAPLRLTSHFRDVSFNGDLYLGNGELLEVSEIGETTEVSPAGITITLAATAGLRNTIATEFYLGRRARVWLGFHDDAGAVVAAPVPLVGGIMDGADYADDADEPTLRLAIATRLRDLSIARERRWSSEDQKAVFPGDKGLRYVEAIQDFEIRTGEL